MGMIQTIWDFRQIKGSRNYQEDFYAVIDQNTIYFKDEVIALDKKYIPSHQILYVLVDGMGGMGHGDIAAKNILDVFIDSYLKSVGKEQDFSDTFNNSLNSANKRIKNMVENKPEYKGMGSTLVAVLWDKQFKEIHWLSIGDSPLWLYRDGQLKRINEIHIWRELIKKKLKAKESIDVDKYKNSLDSLCSAIDGNEIIHVDTKEGYSILPNDILILASDGLESLSVSELENTLKNISDNIKQSNSIQQAKDYLEEGKDTLINLVKSKQLPYQDNTSLILSINLDDSDNENRVEDDG